jgi:hypothetical protein
MVECVDLEVCVPVHADKHVPLCTTTHVAVGETLCHCTPHKQVLSFVHRSALQAKGHTIKRPAGPYNWRQQQQQPVWKTALQRLTVAQSHT